MNLLTVSKWILHYMPAQPNLLQIRFEGIFYTNTRASLHCASSQLTETIYCYKLKIHLQFSLVPIMCFRIKFQDQIYFYITRDTSNKDTVTKQSEPLNKRTNLRGKTFFFSKLYFSFVFFSSAVGPALW